MMDDQDDFSPPPAPVDVTPRDIDPGEFWPVIRDAGKVLLIIVVILVLASL